MDRSAAVFSDEFDFFFSRFDERDLALVDPLTRVLGLALSRFFRLVLGE